MSRLLDVSTLPSEEDCGEAARNALSVFTGGGRERGTATGVEANENGQAEWYEELEDGISTPDG